MVWQLHWLDIKHFYSILLMWGVWARSVIPLEHLIGNQKRIHVIYVCFVLHVRFPPSRSCCCHCCNHCWWIILLFIHCFFAVFVDAPRLDKIFYWSSISLWLLSSSPMNECVAHVCMNVCMCHTCQANCSTSPTMKSIFISCLIWV